MDVFPFPKCVILTYPESLNFQSCADRYPYLIGSKLILTLRDSDHVLGRQVDNRKKSSDYRRGNDFLDVLEKL